MTLDEVMQVLASKGTEGYKQIFKNHGAPEPIFGVKISDMKVLVKQIKCDHQLALELYDTGNNDAMYFAGFIVDPSLMTKVDLEHWAHHTRWYSNGENVVSYVAAASQYGLACAQEWIESPDELVAVCGWATLGTYVAATPDDKLDIEMIKGYLERAAREVHTAPNRVRYNMNQFIIQVGSAVGPLYQEALSFAESIGQVEVYLGKTACKVPVAASYIEKTVGRYGAGHKRPAKMC